jgi:hypothetical protein
MTVSTPDWLVRHSGDLRLDRPTGRWLVYLDNEPQYRLEVRPAEGKFGCEIFQTNNSRHVGSGSAGVSEEEAIESGLEELRQTLGW